MIPTQVFADRRARLRSMVKGSILLMGNGSPMGNIPLQRGPFRQDSTFLYFTGVNLPGAALLMDNDGDTLFLIPPAEDDALWHGHTQSLVEVAERYGFSSAKPRDSLASACSVQQIHTLAVPDLEATREAASLTGSALSFGDQHGSPALVQAVCELRLRLDPHELTEIRRTQAVTTAGHHALMAASRPGITEQQLQALFQGTVAAHGMGLAYPPICTVRGEVLHNFHYDNTLQAGQMLLLDAGAESPWGYATDVTRTWPVNGRFSGRQRAAYEAVLEAQRVGIELVRPGVRYRDIHLASARVIAEFMKADGLLQAPVDEAVEAGAHAAFFPHGVGHLIGLDVHDLENFGDDALYPGRSRSTQFGTQYLRIDLDLKPGMAVTIEPGFYAVEAILRDDEIMGPLWPMLNRERAESWLGFGGIRIEDDVLVTHDGPELLSSVDKTIEAVEARVGTMEGLTIPVVD